MTQLTSTWDRTYVYLQAAAFLDPTIYPDLSESDVRAAKLFIVERYLHQSNRTMLLTAPRQVSPSSLAVSCRAYGAR